jgi:hypothetical protein
MDLVLGVYQANIRFPGRARSVYLTTSLDFSSKHPRPRDLPLGSGAFSFSHQTKTVFRAWTCDEINCVGNTLLPRLTCKPFGSIGRGPTLERTHNRDRGHEEGRDSGAD